MTEGQPHRRVWIYPLMVCGLAALGWFLLLLGLDYLLTFRGSGSQLWRALTSYSPADVQQALGSLPEVVVAILGIAITVVSIILQLAATRYTPRVTEMFFLDRVNLGVMGFFVVASIHCIWATLAVNNAFIPHLMVLATMFMMTAATLILIPYFLYVFAFLDPEGIVKRIQVQSLAEALGRGHPRPLEERKQRVLKGVEQIADVAVNSICQKDRIIASSSVDALRDLVLRYAEQKPRLDALWFEIDPLLRRNPDFVAMAPQSVDALSASHTWLEWKVLRQYQTITTESLNVMRDISQLVAINTRYIGEKSLQTDDRPLLQLAVKFFNTYLRATINGQDVRSAYNTLNQYRLLAEGLVRAGMSDAVIEVARHLKYYGLIANARGLAFINETSAYDLCTLCEVAHLNGFSRERELLSIFLEVDKQPETEAQERSLRGVRKAQIKLATFYLDRGAEELARLVWRDMEQESPERLLSIRREMLSVSQKDFWEVIDRGYNFDYLEPSRKEQLERFYTWFAELREDPAQR